MQSEIFWGEDYSIPLHYVNAAFLLTSLLTQNTTQAQRKMPT
jgi:hypothetical protein